MTQTTPQFELRLMNRRIEPVAQTLVAAVRIDAPQVATARPPLDLVACVDVSGSMAGAKLERARQSLERLVEQLSAGDRLGIVAFESQVHRVLEVTAMTPEGKADARRRIARLEAMGSTALGSGLRASLELLAKGARPGALRRVLLFTDGHANVGLREGDLPGFAALLSESAGGVSASFFGYGEDHDGPFLSALADLAGGNYHHAVDADAILDTFGRELGGLLSVVATDLEVTVRPCPGAGAPAFLNDYRVEGDGGARTLHLPELYAEERRWVVFELPFAQPSSPLPATRPVAEVEVVWRGPSGERERIALHGEVELVDMGLADTPDPEVREQRVLLRAAEAQRRAGLLADRGEFQGAAQLVSDAAAEADALGTELGMALRSILDETASRYGDAQSYGSSRSALAGLRKGMGRSRASGTAADSLFETSVQMDMRRKFREPTKH